MNASSDTSPMRVLIVLTSSNRRGAEIEGARLADELGGRGIHAEAVALAGGNGIVTARRAGARFEAAWRCRRFEPCGPVPAASTSSSPTGRRRCRRVRSVSLGCRFHSSIGALVTLLPG